MEFMAVSRLERTDLKVEVTVPDRDETTRYAYYLLEKNQGVIKKQFYLKESTFSFSLSVSGTYAVQVFVRHWPNGPDRDSVTTVKQTNWIPFYTVKNVRYEEIEDVDFRSTEGTTYNIIWDGIRYEFFIHYNPNCPHAVIFGTGDVGSYPRPYFARISWAGDLHCTTIYYSDPTSYQPPCTLGWGYGTNDRWYLKEISVLLQIILKQLEIPLGNTLFYGSSGGGYTSMLLATMLRSRATVINPQFIIEKFYPAHIARLKQACLKEGEALIPERLRVATYFLLEEYFPQVHVIQNICARFDLKTQLSPFLESLSDIPIDCTNRLHIEFYSHEAGHNGMPPKEVCLKHIWEDLALLETETDQNT